MSKRDPVLLKYYHDRLKILREVAAEHLDKYNECLKEQGHILEKLVGY